MLGLFHLHTTQNSHNPNQPVLVESLARPRRGARCTQNSIKESLSAFRDSQTRSGDKSSYLLNVLHLPLEDQVMLERPLFRMGVNIIYAPGIEINECLKPHYKEIQSRGLVECV